MWNMSQMFIRVGSERSKFVRPIGLIAIGPRGWNILIITALQLGLVRSKCHTETPPDPEVSCCSPVLHFALHRPNSSQRRCWPPFSFKICDAGIEPRVPVEPTEKKKHRKREKETCLIETRALSVWLPQTCDPGDATWRRRRGSPARPHEF